MTLMALGAGNGLRAAWNLEELAGSGGVVSVDHLGIAGGGIAGLGGVEVVRGEVEINGETTDGKVGKRAALRGLLLLVLEEEEAAGGGIDAEHGDVAGGTIDAAGRVVAGGRGANGSGCGGCIGGDSGLVFVEDVEEGAAGAEGEAERA